MSFVEKFKLNLINFFKKGDWVIFGCFFTLMIFGLVTMSTYESGNSIFWRQLLLIGISTSLFFVFSFMDMRFLKNSYLVMALYTFLVTILGLIFVFGHISKGGARWFNLGSFFLGPSEPMKLVLIILLAKFFSKRHLAIANIRNILISLMYLSIPALLVVLQPDLSTAIILCMIWFGMLLISGLSKKHITIFILNPMKNLSFG